MNNYFNIVRNHLTKYRQLSKLRKIAEKSNEAIFNDINEILNEDILSKASLISNNIISGAFRSIFRIQQASEFAEPEVYHSGDSPDNIMWSRLTTYQAKNLAHSFAQEEILAKRYQKESEYEFLIIADISRSMMLRCWDFYNSPYIKRHLLFDCDEDYVAFYKYSKIYTLKIIISAFLFAARVNNYFSKVILFGGHNPPMEFTSRSEAEIEKTLLQSIDDHFYEMAKNVTPEDAVLPDILRDQCSYYRKRIILILSDFTDGIHYINEKSKSSRIQLDEIIPYIAELGNRYRVQVIRINDEWEIHCPYSVIPQEKTPDTPYFNVEDQPIIGIKNTVYAGHRKYVIHAAKKWYDELDPEIRKCGAKMMSTVAGFNMDKLFDNIIIS